MGEILDPAYQVLDALKDEGIERLGLMSSGTWKLDPKRLVFVLSRYKFVAKMLVDKPSVLEIGCGDGFASRIVKQSVESLTAIDVEPTFVTNAKENQLDRYPIQYRCHDILKEPMDTEFDAVYALDVIEHIEPADEPIFLTHILASLKPNGCLILGAPSLESQRHASTSSKMGHVNCKTGEKMKETLESYFHQVFLFSMNDEVVHTGYSPMAQYLFLLCTHPKTS